jgi:hypothetical protein
VTTIPVWNGTTGTFDNATVGPGTTTAYAYHITGGTTTTRCPFTNPPRYETEPNDIYITSTSPLTATELQQALAMETQHSAANWRALRADGVRSIGVFDNPIGVGCG